jgi:hypothetical protein
MQPAGSLPCSQEPAFASKLQGIFKETSGQKGKRILGRTRNYKKERM